MGHMYPKNLSKFMIKRLYARGKVTLKELVEGATKAGEQVSCAEGKYDDDYMLSQAFEVLLGFHMKAERHRGLLFPEQVEPARPLTEEQERVLNLFISGELYDQDFDDSDDWRILDDIPWRFAKGARKLYLEDKIRHLESFTA